MIGQILGHYRIESELGQGGMGVVYKAADTHLDRPVAIKVLRPQAVTDPERRKRFVQEAKAASALNHASILHVYDIDQADGVDFIAMEYVDGRTLDQVIPRKGMRIGDALKIAVQMADALVAAHAAGIIHRDLKPRNLMLAGNGTVKLLDFGLAKLLEPVETDASHPTRTLGDTPHTQEGAIVGTVAYMSPEQAEGKRVDSRSDIFSFGSVLYEMVTGRRPFQGGTSMATLSAILSQEPKPVRELVPELPLELERVVIRCLRKDPDRRYQNIADLRIALEEIREETISGTLARTSQPPRRRVPIWALGAAVILIAGAAALFPWWRNLAAREGQSPVLTRLTSDSGLTADPAISPDGKLVAYASDRSAEGNLDIWVQQVSGGPPLRITHHEADDTQPAFSPDGSQIVFRSERDGGGIYLVPTLGGEQRLFARRGLRPRFSPDGKWILYATGQQSGDITAPGSRKIYVAPAAGGEHKQLARNFAFAITPIWAPDGRHVLFSGAKDRLRAADWDWGVVPLNGGDAMPTGLREIEKRQDFYDAGPEAWSPDGKEVIFSAVHGDSTNLWQVPISARTWHVAGPARHLTTGSSLEAQPSVAQNGILAFSNVTESTNIWSLPVIADQGKISGEMQQLTTGGLNTSPHLSADGRKLAFYSVRPGMSSVWLKDLPAGTETPVSPPGSSLRPAISADGSKVAFSTWVGSKGSIYVVSVGPSVGPSGGLRIRARRKPLAPLKRCVTTVAFP